MRRAAVLGAGSWGTALAVHLARVGHDVSVWARDAGTVRDIAERRANVVYLPDIHLPDTVRPTASLEDALRDTDFVVCAIPSHGCRTVIRAAVPHLAPGAILVSASKGLEAGSLLRMSEVIRQEAGPSHPVAVLSGPSFAMEVARQLPTAVLIASDDGVATDRKRHV